MLPSKIDDLKRKNVIIWVRCSLVFDDYQLFFSFYKQSKRELFEMHLA